MGAGRSAARWARGDRAAAGCTAEAELVRRLRALPGPVPEPQFRAELRAQLVAITARIVSESPAAEPATGPSALAGRRSRAAGGRALRTLRRPALALAGASTVLTLLLGMAVWMSSGSLPGQSLYGVKRASENVQLSMASGDVAKGQAYLQLAGNRVREAADLLSQSASAGGKLSAAGQLSPRTASLVTDTLDSADSDSVNGMRLLGGAAVAQLSREPLTKMSGWLPPHRTLLSQVRDRIPAGPLRTRAQASLLLLQRIATRTGQLSSAMGCSCLARAVADELGPVPCRACGAAPNPAPGGAAPGGGVSAPAPVPGPGLGSAAGPSGSLPTLSLPALGGSGSSAGPPAGPTASRPAGPGLPATSGPPAAPPVSSPAGPGLPTALPSSPPFSYPPHLPTSLGPILTAPASPPLTLPGAVDGLPGLGVQPSLPGVSRP
ncbi:MAG TPA: DUF5667 domain-containing protein [Jatrophihabitans sp.]|jgi:hypothetical protein|uniref:DUF5667 domain-containing protein n=1 Tax=Jatrophihabitans sp. TaxID=1932789 RepID=UPI002F0C969B